MDIGWWVTKTAAKTKSEGVTGLVWGLEKGYHKLIQLSDIFRENGIPIWEYDWDLLVVLDACRYDLMMEVADEYAFISDVNASRSVNSVTRLWMLENFSDVYRFEMSNTAYISGNPWSRDILANAGLHSVSHVWEEAWENPGTVPPDAVTDRAIEYGRKHDPERLIAHYMQPHAPFIPAPNLGPQKQLDHFGDQPEGDVWDALDRGDVAYSDVWAGYRDNLRVVLDDVGRLLQNFDADKVIITSDHGNALGEWGIYGHHPDMPLRCLRQVPLIRTVAEDKGTSDPDVVAEEHDISREDQLRALGYR